MTVLGSLAEFERVESNDNLERFDIANFLPNGFAISGRTRGLRWTVFDGWESHSTH